MNSYTRFTLIELLVVIAIIGVLVSILLPSLSESRGVAKAAVCLAQVKQLSYAHAGYTSENNQKTLLSPNFSVATWLRFLYPYHETSRLYQCPSVEHPEVSGGQYFGTNLSSWGGTNSWVTFYGQNANASYGMNGFAYSELPWFESISYKNMSEPDEPSNTALFADMNWVDAFPRASQANPTTVTGGTANLERIYLYRHVKNRSSFSFMDGSAKHIPVTNILQLDWHKESAHRDIPAL